MGPPAWKLRPWDNRGLSVCVCVCLSTLYRLRLYLKALAVAHLLRPRHELCLVLIHVYHQPIIHTSLGAISHLLSAVSLYASSRPHSIAMCLTDAHTCIMSVCVHVSIRHMHVSSV